MESDAPTQWHLSVVVMLSLCQPYSPAITCLCDEAASVLRCFITREEGDRDNNMQEDMVTHSYEKQDTNTDHCDKMEDMNTGIILTGAIILLIILLIFW